MNTLESHFRNNSSRLKVRGLFVGFGLFGEFKLAPASDLR